MLGFVKVGSEFLVNTEIDGYQYQPTITGLNGGGFVVTWQDDSGTLGDKNYSSIKAQVFDVSGAKEGTEFLVNTQILGRQASPSITDLTNGGFVVTWIDGGNGVVGSGTLGDNNGSSIKAQVFDQNGSKIGTEFLVNTQTNSNQDMPKVTGLVDGGFVVTWQDYSGTLGDSSGSSIKAQVFDASGSKVGNEFLVNTGTTSSQLKSTITGLASGGFIVTWDSLRTSTQPGPWDIRAQIFDDMGQKTGSEIIVKSQDTSLITGSDIFYPKVTSLDDGGFVVSWSDISTIPGDNSLTHVSAQLFDDNGLKIGSEFLVNTESLSDQMQPDVSALSNGDIVFTWRDTSGYLGDGNGSGIKSQIFSLSNLSIESNGGKSDAIVNLIENHIFATDVNAVNSLGVGAIRYSIVGGSDAGKFIINPNTGDVFLKRRQTMKCRLTLTLTMFIMSLWRRLSER